MPVNEQVMDSVSAVNTKNLGDQPAFYAGLAMANAVHNQGLAQSNAVSNQQAMNAIQQAAVGSIVNLLLNIDPAEAISTVKELTGDDIAQKLLNLAAALASNQQGAKIAGNTPPVTP